MVEGWEEAEPEAPLPAGQPSGGGDGWGGSAHATAVPVRREWHLIAAHGHGPYIPVTAAVALVQAERRRQQQAASAVTSSTSSSSESDGLRPWEAAALRPGARQAGGIVPLPAFSSVWHRGGLAIEHASFVTSSGSQRLSNAAGRPLLEEGVSTEWTSMAEWLEGSDDSLRAANGMAMRTEPLGAAVGEHSAAPMMRQGVGEDAWLQLAPAVQRLHNWHQSPASCRREAVGRCFVTGGGGPVGWLVRALLGVPSPIARGTEQPMQLPVMFRMYRSPSTGQEVWARYFGFEAGPLVTRLWPGSGASGAGLVEEQPAIKVAGRWRLHLPIAVQLRAGTFRPGGDSTGGLGIALECVGVKVFGVPVPKLLCPRALGREWEAPAPAHGGGSATAFHFDVSVSLPLFGEVVGYRGYLRERRPSAGELSWASHHAPSQLSDAEMELGVVAAAGTDEKA